MLKKSKKPGKSTSISAEIQNISQIGLWVLVGTKEFFIPFAKFPWFLEASVGQIYDLELWHNTHLRWPSLDIDIDLDSLAYPDSYPLQYS